MSEIAFMKPENVNKETSVQTGSSTPFMDAIQHIKEMRDDAKFEMEKLMRRRGWEYTSSTPGCRWMWEKKLPDGRTALVDLETAVNFEIETCGEHDQDLGG